MQTQVCTPTKGVYTAPAARGPSVQRDMAVAAYLVGVDDSRKPIHAVPGREGDGEELAVSGTFLACRALGMGPLCLPAIFVRVARVIGLAHFFKG